MDRPHLQVIPGLLRRSSLNMILQNYMSYSLATVVAGPGYGKTITGFTTKVSEASLKDLSGLTLKNSVRSCSAATKKTSQLDGRLWERAIYALRLRSLRSAKRQRGDFYISGALIQRSTTLMKS
jgi:hypothetical protein